MLADFGNAALYIAFGASVWAILMGLYGGLRHDGRWVTSARNATLAVFPLLLLAAVIIVAATLTDDYSIAYVSQVTSRATPTALKVTALWGGQAGSLLLWNLFLAGFMTAAMVRKWDEKELMPYVIVVGGLTQAFFLLLTAFPENPFVLNASIPADGNGLSPLLRHPLMIIHPPMLYLGYTGFVIPYAFAMAALIVGRLDDAWIRTTRRWTLAAWLFLSLGLILGGRWAHDVLGWGGYWAWDPVENAAFMPWLAGTAFLHSVMIQEKRGMFKMWNIVLVILTYLMIVYGTLIVRTGLLKSVHAFAQSEIQWHFFVFTAGMILFSTFWATYRAEALRSKNYLASLLSREAAFLMNNFVIIAILLIIFLFTNYSLLSELFTGQEYGVGEATYEMAVGPLFGILLFLMGIAPLTMWYRTSLKRLEHLARWPAAAASVVVIVLFIAGIHQPGALIGMWVVFFSGILTIMEYVRGAHARVKKGESWLVALGKLFERNQRRYGGYLIHLGIIVMAFGIIGTEFFQRETQIFLQRGEQITFGDYTLEFQGAQFFQDDDVTVAQATTAVYDNEGNFIRTLQPRTEVFQNGEGMTHPDAISGLGTEFYVILVNWEGVTAEAATLRIYLTPLINWVWAGGFVFIIGTLIAAWPDALDEKVVVAARRRREVPAVAGD